MTLFRAGILLLLLSAPALAQQGKKTAIDLVQAELSVCVAYYTFVRGCAIEKSDINSATVATATIGKLRKFAFQAGQTISMDTETMLSRLKIALDQQSKLLDGNCENIAKLDESYGPRCKQLSDDPQSVLDQYLKR